MKARSATAVVLFDGRCSLCQRSRKWATRLDWFGSVIWINFRDPQVRAEVPQLSEAQLEKEMWVFRADGRMLPGFQGWRHLVNLLPLTFVPSLLLYVPPVPFFGRRVYAFIAARRPLTCQLQTPLPTDGEAWRTILRSAPKPDSTTAIGTNPELSEAALRSQ